MGTRSRLALVTGGTAGIGAAISVALKAAGYRVVASYARNAEGAAAFSASTAIAALQWNVADMEACQRGLARVEADQGPVDILVNNAGITRDAMLHKMTPAQWNEVLAVDLTGCFHMCRLLIGGMRERRFGRIINISSVNGLSGQAGQTNYAAAKAGLIGFTKALALEVAAKGITANAIAPGYTDTAMVAAVRPDAMVQVLASIPVGRLARPAEIARCVVFLADDAAGYINGITLSVNGGKYMA